MAVDNPSIAYEFTFHYASTLSGNRYENFLLGFLFTFHYASTLSS